MNRRKFIRNTGLFTGSLAINLGGVSLQAIANPIQKRTEDNNEKIVVFVQLFGGNDGLNTLIPFENDIYYKNRPTIAIKKEKVLRIDDSLGFHPTMNGFTNLFKDGKMSIIQNVGYNQPNRSHFRSTDIWNSASESDEYLYNGWAARYLSSISKSKPENLTSPLAVELGWSGSLLLEDHKHSHGLFMNSLEEYKKLLQTDANAPSNNPNSNLKDQEYEFINIINLQSNKFSSRIKDCSLKGSNLTSYPDTFLGRQLAIVAKLISGGLDTSVYVTKLGGFDTHINQAQPHAALLSQVSDAIYAFQKDIQLAQASERVSILIYSEFGRRLKEGGLGTDHGTAAPIFVIGDSVRGGIIGQNPDLSQLDENGDLLYKYDFKQIYNTILKDHLVSDQSQNSIILNKEFTTLPIYKNSITSFPEEPFTLDYIYPNPFGVSTNISYKLFERGNVELMIHNERGALVAILSQGPQLSGEYILDWKPASLQAGMYICSLKVNGTIKSKRILKVK